MDNFVLKTPFADLTVRSFGMVDPTILKPESANPMVMGEFLELDTSAYKLKRGTGDGTNRAVYAMFTEQGRYDVQAVEKATSLFIGHYEADTKVFDGTNITAAGQPLMVGDVTIGGLTKRGLKALPGTPTGNEHIVGYVTRLPANNSGKLRFVRNDG